MKSKLIVLLFLLALLLPAPAFAQTRKRSIRGKRPARAAGTAGAASSAAQQAAEVRLGAERVSEQLKNLTRFVYLFGRISNGVEASEQLQKQANLGNSQVPQLEKMKSGLRDGVRNVRAGLIDLEAYFEKTPAVRRFYPQVAGVADGAAVAEQLATAGQYDQAGRSLLGVAGKLADALIGMH